jgi:hypothetical protein
LLVTWIYLLCLWRIEDMVLSRSWYGFLIATLLMLIPSSRVRAQQQPNRAFLEAALVIRSFDQLSDQCKAGKGFTKKQSAAIAAWEAKQNVNALRTQVRSLSSTMQQQIEQGSAKVTAALLKEFTNATPCEIAATIITTPKAKFTVSNSKPESLPDRNPNQTGTTSSPSTTVRASVRVSEIDSFGFDTRVSVGVGGFIGQDVYPVVLFRNGDALKEVKALAAANGLAEHRSSNPKAWTKWQRKNGKIELLTAKGWKALPFNATYQALPAQFRLDGTYRSLSGAGNVAIGGSASVAAWSIYTFSSEGRVIRGRGAGSSNAGVVTSSVAPSQRGRYQIDGLTLRMTYDDGSTEERLIIANPKDPKTAIWLDGSGYSKRR